MEMATPLIDYELYIRTLIESTPNILAAVIIEGKDMIVYSTDNWDIAADVGNVCAIWNSKKIPFIMISGIRYDVEECEINLIIANSPKGEGHVVGCKDEVRKILTYVKPGSDTRHAVQEISKVLVKIYSETKYTNPLLLAEIREFLGWARHPKGLKGYLEHYLEQNDPQKISEIAEIFHELKSIFRA